MELGAEEVESDKSGYINLARRRVRHINTRTYKVGVHRCEHCNWKPPESSMLHAHHVIPLACEGEESRENIIVLCPNCHAIAHYVTTRSNLTRTYQGPQTASELREWMRMAYKPNALRELQRSRLINSVLPMLAEMRA